MRQMSPCLLLKQQSSDSTTRELPPADCVFSTGTTNERDYLPTTCCCCCWRRRSDGAMKREPNSGALPAYRIAPHCSCAAQLHDTFAYKRNSTEEQWPPTCGLISLFSADANQAAALSCRASSTTSTSSSPPPLPLPLLSSVALTDAGRSHCQHFVSDPLSCHPGGEQSTSGFSM